MSKEEVDLDELKSPEEVKTEHDKKIDGTKKSIDDLKAKI